ncbi:MAG: NADH:ubiquinone reductase (Na(+)-transporting) subunit C [Thermodesulfobacteriota bacterium]|nr:NADH:ubiquinone reductase (Na(+)-transporting) subunit C [Thermodesulfobacteriota bacterium]
MSDYMKSIVFALVLCLVCSVLLTSASVGLRPYQQRNLKVDRQKNILLAVGLIRAGKTYSPERITQLYDDHIRCLWISPAGNLMTPSAATKDALHVYLNITTEQTIKNYIIPINTRGLWGRIKGYLALEKDGETVAGFTVYKHSETPGLGGEIEKQWFQENFKGKKIVNQENEFVSVQIAKGKVEDNISKEKREHYVDGISGATLTGKYLSRGLESVLKTYEPVSVQFRQNRLMRLPTDKSGCEPENRPATQKDETS